jgi:uncharacterized protein
MSTLATHAAATPALDTLDWTELGATLDEQGFAITPPLLTHEQCAQVSAMFDDDDRFRSTVVMARHAFGEGQYRYFADPLPELVQTLRVGLYPPLARIANAWADRLGEPAFPATLDALLDACARVGQTKPTPLVLRYGPTGYNCLHQDVYGEHLFPLQATFLLSRPEGDPRPERDPLGASCASADFAGGEFVLVEQRPRMQSRAMVVPLRQGDAVIFAVNQRPVQGARGAYRVTLRHGVSEIRSGQRYTLGVIFHDAT